MNTRPIEMKRITLFILSILGCLSAVASAPLPLVRPESAAGEEFVPREPITPIPQDRKLDSRKVALGERLFHEPRLSKDNTLSCASCHDLRKGGTDQSPTSLGIGGARGKLNAPTVFNSGFNFNQFWDGRAHSLADQIDGPLQSPIEMGSTWDEVVAKLRGDPAYVAAFRQVYGAAIQPTHIKDAIVQFEESLYTPNARFDQFLRGDDTALTADEKAGYRKFKSYGCTSCHQGVNIGGNMFQTFGAMADYFVERGNITPADFGRFNVTGKEEDRFVFKVPSLRNVALTAPYFHDGSVERLEDAVAIMGRYQLGRKLSDADTNEIVKFLKTLTGEYKGKPL
jgi:cytochrome c peroxidase